jgi:hypothetical protein
VPAVAETARIVVFVVFIVVGWPSSGVRDRRGQRRDVGYKEVVFEIGIAIVIEVGKHMKTVCNVWEADACECD